MPFLLLKDIPRYDCLQEAAQKYPDMDPSACEVFLHLLRVGDELGRAQQDYFGQHNISQGRFTVLMLLLRAANGGSCAQGVDLCNPAELADRAGVTRATMTGLVDTLEKDGYVKRVPDPRDRRMMSVHLTPKGEAFMEGLLPGYFRRISGIMERLQEDERRLLVSLLHKIAEKSPAGPKSAPSTV